MTGGFVQVVHSTLWTAVTCLSVRQGRRLQINTGIVALKGHCGRHRPHREQKVHTTSGQWDLPKL